VQWTVGRCANCDAPLDLAAGHARLFCGSYCRSYAKDVRYFRACRLDGRHTDPLVGHALRVRLAHLVAGGYDETARRVSSVLRAQVLTAAGGMCAACGQRPAIEVDHVDGSSGARENLQGLCGPCHRAKTAARLGPMSPDQLAVRAAFISRVEARSPARACDDDVGWNDRQPHLLERTRAWWWSAQPTEYLGRVEFTPDGRPVIIEPASSDGRGR
jgi:5-methylcytosine-specific restriction endonuclease McrA